jgi:ubiquitin carboxyl-terminal hydrolase MINDY-1/2
VRLTIIAVVFTVVKDKYVHILLQNENGPCPLLAASNCLLLKGFVVLPPRAIRNGVTSLEDITNMLANYAMQAQQAQQQLSSSESDSHNQFSLNEFMNYIPNFQYGMDVNPKFTVGCQGYEYTAELSVLSDMLGCKLVHGWLIDPIENEATAIAAGNKSYNELIDRAIVGKGAEMEVSRLQTEIENIVLQYPQITDTSIDTEAVDLPSDGEEAIPQQAIREKLSKLRKQQTEMQDIAISAQLIENFLADSSHQLTTYGLEQLHDTIRNGEIGILFRNNHFSTIVRHGDNLYLLVTDLGYANTSTIVWEKLDVVDGDTEFCDAYFICNQSTAMQQSGPTLTPEQMMASSHQNDADYQLALQLSLQSEDNNVVNSTTLSHEELSLHQKHNSVDMNSGRAVAGTIVALPDIPNTAGVEVGIPIPKPNTSGVSWSQEEADRILALQLQGDYTANNETNSTDDASLRLARQLQQEENARAAMVLDNNTNTESHVASRPVRPSRIATQPQSNCTVM